MPYSISPTFLIHKMDDGQFLNEMLNYFADDRSMFSIVK